MDRALPRSLDYDERARELSLDPRDPLFVQDPYAVYAWLRERTAAFFWKQYGLWCFGGYDDVNRLLRDRRFGREHPGGYMAGMSGRDRSRLGAFDAVEAASLLELEPPVHTRLRTLVNRAFVSRQIERLRPKIEALANSLIDAFADADEVDLIPAYATPLPATIIAEMMGLPAETGPQLVAWSNAMVRMYTHAPTPQMETAANDAALAFAGFVRDHARRRGPGDDDLLGVLVSAREDGERLSEAELVSSAILLLNAGHEATVHQTGNAVRAVLAQGGDPRRFFATPQATLATVEECLRFDAPLHMFDRFAYEEVEFSGGVRLRPGQKIGLLLGAANRDDRAFADAGRFDPQRADQKLVSFGAGIHFCIGAPLARLELQIGLKALFDRLPKLALAEAPRYRDSYHFHGLEALKVKPGG